jgi:hypothetical protein
MQKIKGYIIIVLGFLVSIVMAALGALALFKSRIENKRLGNIAKDLAKKNAERAREQAKEAKKSISAQAENAIKKTDDKAIKDASNESINSNLADYLNKRRK